MPADASPRPPPVHALLGGVAATLWRGWFPLVRHGTVVNHSDGRWPGTTDRQQHHGRRRTKRRLDRHRLRYPGTRPQHHQWAGRGTDVLVRVGSKALLTSESAILTDTAILPPEVDIAGSLARLSTDFAKPAARLTDLCGARRAKGRVSSFVSTGRIGTPIEPGRFIPVFEIRSR